MSYPATLAALRQSEYTPGRVCKRKVKDELRENLIARIEKGGTLFPGIIGYDDTVVPQIINAILSRHHFILLGLRGQAKSRILRELTGFLDEVVPVVAGCEINDNPYEPICRSCRLRLGELGDKLPIAWLPRQARYVEKLATPDVTIADILGDVDPIRAARSGLNLSDELTIHYGLMPRAHRGILAINELPDLAPKIQVGLFNILQEGDVQIKGYPIRLPLDLLMVFTANPEDYTARGKIITPLKDRIGSEVKTHYPATLGHGLSITEQEAWVERSRSLPITIPKFIREIVEQIAFEARADQRVDKRSGVSQRMPISCLENALSNAERRALFSRERTVVPRISDIYAAIPALTGKMELEYEGEVKGADSIARDLIREAVGRTFSRYFHAGDFKQVIEWFDLGGTLKLSDTQTDARNLEAIGQIQGLGEKLGKLGIQPKDSPGLQVSGAEFILAGLHAQKKLNRSEESGYHKAQPETRQPFYEDVKDFRKKPV